MTRNLRISGTIAAAALVLVAGVPAAQAVLATTQIKCLAKEAKAGGKFVAKALKATQKCKDASVNAVAGDECSSTPVVCVGGANAEASCTVDSECPGGSCAAALEGKIDKLKTDLIASIHSKCFFLTPPEFGPTAMLFPGKCPDLNPADAFTFTDLEYCISTSHPTVVADLIGIEYGSTTGPLGSTDLKCQQTIAKNGAKFVNTKLKAIQKCHDGLLNGKLSGFAAGSCRTTELSPAKATIDKAETKTRTAILDKCTDGNILALDVCDPKATTAVGAADCIIATHGDAVDNNDPTKASLIDFEYAAKQPVCGDNFVNAYEEECDGTADGVCPGLCGAPGGLVACLCTTIPRERIWEHSNADLDNGWTGDSHDSGVVEGGGYVADLYDCNGPTGSDPLCTVGPSCAVENPPFSDIHAPCSKNSDCGLNGPCRKRRTAVGPHCALDIQQACSGNGDCPGSTELGNVCLKTAHGAPLPISGGGVSVCVVNIFSADVTGTRDLVTGAGAVFMRQASVTHLGPSMQQPCPVCGGFCADPPGGARNLCTSAANCLAGPDRPENVPCTADTICSFGPSVDKACRPDPPYGGGTDYFGNTSVDCLPPPGQNISGGGLDIIWNPVGTGTTGMKPTLQCNAFGFGGTECVDGPTPGKTCASNGDCGGGTCNGLCYCPQTGGGTAQKPNRCASACVGGSNPDELCTVHSECPGGFCHLADCRVNPLDSSNPNFDGICTSGPVAGTCQFHPFKTCNDDGDCAGVNCPFCFPSEQCILKNSQCFPSGGYTRVGMANPITPIVGAVYCIQATTSAAINNTAGLPGPGAIRQFETPYLYGFPP